MLPLLLLCTLAAPAAQLPEVVATNLAGQQLTLPADLVGEQNLLLVGFTRAQQDEVETWLLHRASLEGLAVYQVPLMGPLPGFLRAIIERSMRAEYPGLDEQARLVPIYVKREPVLASLEVEDTSTMAALLVDRDGVVVWSARGPYREAALTELLSALAR